MPCGEGTSPEQGRVDCGYGISVNVCAVVLGYGMSTEICPNATNGQILTHNTILGVWAVVTRDLVLWLSICLAKDVKIA